VEGARRLTDRGQRMAMYRQAERLLVQETPLIPISYTLAHLLLKPWVVHWPVSSTTFILKDVIIEAH
jgi:ABC-type oligopeptide transport system substrate-binding subunit